MAYVEYLDGLPAPNGSTCVVQANANTMRSFLYNRQVEQFLSRAVDAFSQADIGLCLDDFGSGFANLNTVTHLPFFGHQARPLAALSHLHRRARRAVLSEHRLHLPADGL